MYHYVNIEFVVRNCDNIDDAVKQCESLLPQYPDENTIHIESWNTVKAYEGLPNRLYRTSKEYLP
jgi:hypothetical protein